MQLLKAFIHILRKSILPSLQSIFTSIGFICTLTSATSILAIAWATSTTIIALFIFLWWLVAGIWVTGFLRHSITIYSNCLDTKFVIKFGDIFSQKGIVSIPVNNYFDSQVDDRHVAHESLHGVLLNRYWGTDVDNWNTQVEQQLTNVPYTNIVRTSGKTKCYELGTTVLVQRNAHSFLCVALTRTDPETLQAKASAQDLILAIRGLLKAARTHCAGKPINLPLIGSGLPRVGLPHNVLIDLILTAVYEESKENKITNEIRIILPIEAISKISLTYVKQLIPSY